MNNFKIKLFDELVIKETDLAHIIKDYIFPRPYYERELKKRGFGFLRDNQESKNFIIENKNNITPRNKNIIFLGYDKIQNNKYVFLQLKNTKSIIIF